MAVAAAVRPLAAAWIAAAGLAVRPSLPARAPGAPLPSVPALLERFRATLAEPPAPALLRQARRSILVGADARLLHGLPADSMLGELYDGGFRAAIADGRTIGLVESEAPLGRVVPAPARPLARALVELRATIATSVPFEPGERVRARDAATGRLLEGPLEFVGLHAGERPSMSLWDPRARRLLSTRPGYVYKEAAGPQVAVTLAKPGERMWAAFEPSDRGVAEFLDGAAWLGSHPEFQAAGHERRWAWLAEYVSAVVRPHPLAGGAELLGIGFPELLELGWGVCRHVATAFAAVGLEAGYHVPIVLGGEHAWNEIHGPLGHPPLVRDVTLGRELFLHEAEALAATDPLAARFYARRDVARLPPRPAPLRR